MFRKFRARKMNIALLTAGLIWSMLGARAMAAGVTLTAPGNGATVSGIVTVTLTINPGTSWCNLYIDGVYQNSTPPTLFYWQTTGVTNGSHTVSATAYATNGSNLGSSSATVTVANGVPPNPSAVSLTAPSNGATVSGNATISLTIAPPTSWANIYINGVYQESTPPTTFTWNTKAMANGPYQVSAVAFDQNGHNLGSSQANVTVLNGTSSTTSSNAVAINAPAGGSTVSGNVNIATSIGAGVSWINVYVDGNYLSSSPPLSFNWNSDGVNNGSHTISALAFSNSGSQLGSASTVVNVQNSSTMSSAHFYTLPPGSSLPSGSSCTSAVRRNPNFEPRPENYVANHTVPSGGVNLPAGGGAPQSAFTRVDGNFTGTTDEIMQWGACKWGFDEDLVRALAANETWWRQSGAGDLTFNLSLCPPGAVFVGGECSQTYGIMQIKSNNYPGTFPNSHTSTAFNVDYKLAYQRACFEGQISYLSQRSSNYPNNDANNMLWGCVDQWYNGTWWNGTDDAYITETRGELANKPWLQPGF
jgi:hypothetical protein